MTAQLPLAFAPPPWRRQSQADRRDWLEAYREAEAACEAAAEAVRAACDAYRAARGEDTASAYRKADRAYDAARLQFQVTSCGITQGIRAIAGIARHMQLANDSDRRML